MLPVPGRVKEDGDGPRHVWGGRVRHDGRLGRHVVSRPLAPLDPLGLGYIHTLAFILVIASLVQFIDIAMKRFVPPLHAALGIFLPLITTNCAVLGVAELNCKNGTPFLESVLFSFAAALGFGFALVIFSGLREKLAWADPPRCFRGIAVALVTAGLLSLAFMGFNGLVKLPY